MNFSSYFRLYYFYRFLHQSTAKCIYRDGKSFAPATLTNGTHLTSCYISSINSHINSTQIDTTVFLHTAEKYICPNWRFILYYQFPRILLHFTIQLVAVHCGSAKFIYFNQFRTVILWYEFPCDFYAKVTTSFALHCAAAYFCTFYAVVLHYRFLSIFLHKWIQNRFPPCPTV